MRALLCASAIALALGGCGFTGTGDSVRQGVATKGAQAYDEGLANSVWFICNAASIGSVKRRWGRTQEDANAYKAICDGADGVDILEPS